MKNWLSIGLLAICALSSCGGGTGASTMPPAGLIAAADALALPAPPDVVSQNGVARLTLTAMLDGNGRPAFQYQGQFVAPTIRVAPGETIAIHFVNALPEFCGAAMITMANLHFHGLEVSPNAPADDSIDYIANPGQSIDYTVQIPADHPPGITWYHPHAHGLAEWQVGEGMSGAIVINGLADEVPAVANLRERVIVLRDIFTDPSYSAVTTASLRRRAADASRRATNDLGEPSMTCGAEPGSTVTVNGVPAPHIGIQPGEKQLFRVVNAAPTRHFDVSVDGESITLIGLDGTPLRDYAGNPTTRVVSHVLIPPAGRAEFIVTGPSAANVYLRSACVQTGSDGDPNPEVILGSFYNDKGTSSNARMTLAGHEPNDYRTPPSAPVAQRAVHFTEDDNGFYIEGKKYSPASAPNFVVRSGTVEEWTVYNATDEVHDFHLHQVHFVVESTNGIAELPSWRDTVLVPPQVHGVNGVTVPGQVTFLADFRDAIIRGTFLYHCHILEHEDGGMMAKVQVL